MDLLLLTIKNPHPRTSWQPGDIVYYWSLGQIHKAVFCRWTVGDHLWCAVFDIHPKPEPIGDGYDYVTQRASWNDLFADRNELADIVTEAFRNELINYEETPND